VLPPAWRELGLVILTATIVGMTIALTVPLLTVNLERAGADPLTIGLNAAAGGVGIFLIGPFIGRLVARLGPVACFRLGIVVCAACLLAFAALPVDPWSWGAVRLVYGCAAALMFVLNEASVNGLTPDGQRGRVLGVYATLFTVGYAGGPLLLLVAGTQGAAPFLAAAALFAAALLPTLLLGPVEDRLRPPAGAAGPRYALADIWRAAPLPMAAVLVYAFAEGAAFALMPVWALRIGLSEAAAAALVGVFLSGNILLQVPLGWLADRVPRALVVAGCGLASACGLALLPLLAAGGPGAALWALLVLLGGLTGGLYTLALTLLGDRFRGADLTVANTAFVMTFQLGMIAGPPVTGAVMDLAGPVTGFPAALVPPLAALGLLALAFHRRRRARLDSASTTA
jgi:MFS family permease